MEIRREEMDAICNLVFNAHLYKVQNETTKKMSHQKSVIDHQTMGNYHLIT
jgi:hypothetical protein